MGFEGIVVSDYGSIEAAFNYHHVSADRQGAGAQAVYAGTDIELPNTACYGDLLQEAMAKGLVEEATVDMAVRRVLAAKFKLGLFENPYVEVDRVAAVFSQPENLQTARLLAQKSITLLKNRDHLLPLSKDSESIAVIGPNAASIRNLLSDYSFVAQMESIIAITTSGAEGDESVDKSDSEAFMNMFKEILESEDEDAFARKNHPQMQSILQSVQAAVGNQSRVVYAKGCDVVSDDRSGFAEAVSAAESAKAAVLVLGDQSGLGVVGTSGEGRDRVSLTLPGVQQELLEAVHATGTPVILVLVNGRPLSLPWAEEHIPAILEVWLPGEEGGPPVADVLFGDVNPGGKLPISIPRCVGQVPVYYYHKPSGGRSYMTGHYIDSPATPLYPFGFGLSYTEFEFSNVRTSSAKVNSQGQIDISCDVKNVGKLTGDEVVQLYLHDSEATITRPIKQLAGFKRVTLATGKSCTVTFTVQMSQLGFYNREMEFVVEPGRIDVMIGSSSSDIHLRTEFEITGDTICVLGERSFSSKAVASLHS
jgi:beta-glucosidase